MPHRNMKDVEELEKSLKLITEENKHNNIILAGDFNCPDINWEKLTTDQKAQDKEVQKALVDITTQNGLTQLHEEPTRENNLLDLIFTTNPSLVKSTTNIPGISDHAIVVADIDTKPYYQKNNPRKAYIWSKANWDDLNKDLESITPILEAMNDNKTDINNMWTTFKQELFKHLDKHVPSKMIKSNNRLPWINHKIRKQLKKKQRLYQQAKRTKQWANYRHYQKECKREIRKAEWNYINTAILEGMEKNNSKPFWKYVKSRKQDNIGVAPLKDKGKLVNDSKGKAELLLQQFSSVFTRQKVDQKPDTNIKVKNSIPHINIRPEGVEKLLRNINTSKASGPDNIPNKILKECAKQLAPSMSIIFQCSINSGKLPKDWLSANISCIFKKGDKHAPENYRPVSLTSVPCKLLEHIICRHMLKHLEKHKVLTSLNHGFRSGYSCETQLAITIHDMLQSFDKGKQLDIAILDFSKAFDTVPHDRLLHKIHQYGIRGNIHKWLTSFLTERQMRVQLEGEFSSHTSVDSGVPQGTVLGPILFLCHINDLPDAVSSQVRLFADDCLLYREINTYKDHDILQKDLKQLEEWASNWGMRFNAKKCYILSLKMKSRKYYTLNNHILEQVTSNPYLGLQIAEDLKWKENIKITSVKRQIQH